MDTELFFSDDLYLISALSLILQIKPTLRIEANGRVTFCLPLSENLRQGIIDYNRGAVLPAIELCQTLKRIRSMMYANRGAQKGRN